MCAANIPDNVSAAAASMKVVSVQRTSDFRMKITLYPESVFFIRELYLNNVIPDTIQEGVVLSESQFADVLQAASAYAAECAASRLLERSEQCRAGLRCKLQRKGFEQSVAEKALDYLESAGFLSDLRFASAWLRNRIISVPESPMKFAAELQKRGISRNVAEQAIEELLALASEEQLFERALAKCRRKGFSAEKIIRSLMRHGFSYHYIRKHLPC